MLKTDYLMTQLEQLSRFLAQVMLRRRAGERVSEQELDAAVASLSGMPLATLLAMPLPVLLDTLEPQGGRDWAKTRLLARLLAERSRLATAADEAAFRAEVVARKAFLLLDEVSRLAPAALAPEDEAVLVELLDRLAGQPALHAPRRV